MLRLVFLVGISIFAHAGDYQNDYASWKDRVPIAVRENALAEWREREPNNPDVWILSSNWFLERAKVVNTGDTGIDMTKAGEFKVRRIEGEEWIFDPKTNKRIGRFSYHDELIPELARASLAFVIEARKRFPHRIDIHMGIVHLLGELNAAEEQINAIKELVASARTYRGKLRWCHEEPLSETEDRFISFGLHEFAIAQYRKETLDGDTRFFEIVQLMIEAYPNEPIPWNDLAIYHGLKQNYPEAQKALEKAAAVTPDDPTVLFNLARNSLRVGLRDQAVKTYRKLIEMNKDPEITKDARAELTELEKRHK